jgi:hypothetical protein
MSTALARRFKVDVTADLTLTSGWVNVKGINDLSPNVDPNIEDASDYDTDGWTQSEITMQAWTLDTTFFRKENAGTYDAGQELIRARVGKFGDDARIGVRWYDRNDGPEAAQGVALVSWKLSNTGVKDLASVQATFTGTDVALDQTISNPSSGAAVPVILSATPSGAGEGDLVEIKGTGFDGLVASTGVKFGAVSATNWSVVSDQVVVATVPAGSAGAANIVATNAAGASTAFSYTRGA